MYEKQIQAGIEKLNEYFGGPEGWIYKIDPGILDIADTNVCVVGQLDLVRSAGNWLARNDSHAYPAELGFDIIFTNGYSKEQCASILTEEWIDAIKELVNKV